MAADITYFDVPTSFRVNAVVGQGGYGAVCRAEIATAQGDRTVAIKKVPHYNKNMDTAKKVLRELLILRHLQTVPQVVPCHAVIRPVSSPDVYIVMDYFPSDMSSVIKATGQALDESRIRYFLAQLLLGLRGAHKAGIVHRDLSTRNLLVDERCTLCIADFGLARFFDPEERMSFGVVTQWYRAPEVLTDSRYDAKIDVWSAGVIMAELFLRGHLFAGKPNDLVDQLNKIMKVVGVPDPQLFRNPSCILGSSSENAVRYVERVAKQTSRPRATLFQPEGPKFIVEMSAEAKDLLGKLLTFNPDERPTADEALRHPWFSSPDVADYVREEMECQEQSVTPFPMEALQAGGLTAATASAATSTLQSIVASIEEVAKHWSTEVETALQASLCPPVPVEAD